jgi:hypothetical protein
MVMIANGYDTLVTRKTRGDRLTTIGRTIAR